jgi:hypothetical protein
VGIYQAAEAGEEKGDPVVWIELLSPSNKPGGQAAFRRLPNYRAQKQNGQNDDIISPYRIVVINPRPDIETGYGRVYPFQVDKPLPLVDIPLNGDDLLKFDFGPAYDKTFAEVLYGTGIDYSQLPVHFDRYREPDQARIISRMLAVLEAAQARCDLEQPPQPIETLPLDEALKRLEAYHQA